MFLKSSEEKLSNEEILAQIVEKHPIELEERIQTLDKPLILEVACPGWQPRDWPDPANYPWRKPVHYIEGGIRYPAVPCSIEDQVKELVDAVQAGCQATHVHPRDPEDCIASTELDLLVQVYDGMFSAVDAITIQHTWKIKDDGTIDYIEEAEKMLEAGNGNKYCQGAVVLWPPTDSYPKNYTRAVQDAIRFMEKHQIKPIHKLRSSYHVRQMYRTLVETNVITEEPLVLVHDMGHPFGWPMDQDPWMPIDLITSIEQTKQRMPNSVVGVFSGGRNWFPITVTSILYGADIVRVGIEDIYWMYPHRDEVVPSNMACVQKVIDFCRSVGRPLATVDQAREILGITKTS